MSKPTRNLLAPDMAPVLSRLIEARKMAGFNQTEAALVIGLTRASSLSDLETGRNEIKVSQLLALCYLYDVSPAWVIGESDRHQALECDRCGSTDLWYWDGYWRCGSCRFEWPDQQEGS